MIGFSSLPELGLNYATGGSGSYFKIFGANFTPDTAVEIFANGESIGTVQTDGVGAFLFSVQTLPGDSGYYTLTARDPGAAGGAPGLRAAAPFEKSILFGAFPNRPHRIKEGTMQILSIPGGTTLKVYLPEASK